MDSGILSDTIVAVATPAGMGAIGIIRLSGDKALAICQKFFPSKDLDIQAANTLHVGSIIEQGRVIDETVLSLFRAPRSYTGEDIVEISCHGSPFILQQVVRLCVEKGARLANPGEFTLRAFLNGKLDLAQAEAVADLISSNTTASHRTALQHIRGGFSNELKKLRDDLLRFSALIELELDFSQEDLQFADRQKLVALVHQCENAVRRLIDSFKLGNVFKNGVNVVIFGRPNAGKSTLLNALLNEDRALVSDIPGTTRDAIEATINIGGVLFRVIDTAGIREKGVDQLENMGMSKSLELLDRADIALYVFDVITFENNDFNEVYKELNGKHPYFLLVGNKTDLSDSVTLANKYLENENIIFLSAKNGQYIDDLKQKLLKIILNDKAQPDDIVVSNERHLQALNYVKSALEDVEKGLSEGIAGDLLSLDLRRALQGIGEITGEIINEERLDYIFSKFCIGK
jgi:tRNA modification GTPase